VGRMQGKSITAIPRELVYRISPANEGLVFATLVDACRNHTMRTAIQYSRTWSDFRRAVGNDEYRTVLRIMSMHITDPVEVPNDEAPFNSGAIPGYGDGDYPEWLQSKMDVYLPAQILAKFGELVATRLNGDYFHIDSSFERRMVSALRKLGYQVQRREDLFFT
jgi:hypothetical protein